MKTHECTGNPARFKSGAKTSESDPADWDGQILRVSPDFGSPSDSGERRQSRLPAKSPVQAPSILHCVIRIVNEKGLGKLRATKCQRQAGCTWKNEQAIKK